MNLFGTRQDDRLFAIYGIDTVFAGGGDDHVFLFNGLDMNAKGGSGHDIFEFRVFEDQSYDISRDGAWTSIVIEGDDYHQEIRLRGFEEVVAHVMDF